jgi:MFS family permease
MIDLLCFHVRRPVAVVVILLAGISACLVSGTMYAVSLWLPLWKDQLFYTQTEANVVGAAGSIGQYLGFLAGILNDSTSSRLTMLVGGSLAAIGYGALAFGSFVGTCPPALAAFLLFIVGLGQFATFTAGYSPSVLNISASRRSRVMGVMVGAFAASSLLFSLFFRLFFSISGFLLLLSCSVFVVTTLAGAIVRILPAEESADLSIATDVELIEKSVDEEVQVEEKSTEQRVDVSPLECLRRADFWLLVLALALTNGPGLFWITLQGSVARSLLLDTSANLVVLLAVGSIAGRLGIAFLSDGLASRVSRSWLLLPCSGLMCVSLAIFAFFQTQAVLYLTSVLVGAAYGMCYVVVTTVSSFWFGVRYVGTNNGIMSVGTALIVLALGLLNGQIYGSRADPQNRCFGPDCFFVTMLVASGLALIAMPVVVFVTIKYGRK